MTGLVSAIGMLAMLAALAATMLLDLARETDGAGPARTGRLGRMFAGIATDRRAVGYLVVGLVLVGAVCTVIRLGRLA